MRPTPRVPRRHSRRLESPKARRRKSRWDRSDRHRAAPLAIHRPAPRLRRRSPVRMPETGVPVARPSTNHRVRDFGDNLMTRRRKHAPRKAPFPIDRRRPQAPAVSPLRTRPLRRVQVSRWRAFSSGRFGKRPSAPPGCDALGVPSRAERRFGRAYRLAIWPNRYTGAFNAPYALTFDQVYWPSFVPQDKT